MPDPRAAKSVAQRVEHVIAVMELGLWDKYLCRELAGIWGISVKTVQTHSAEAHRRLCDAQKPVDKARSRSELTGKLRTWAALDAREGNRRSANRHLELVAKLEGLIINQHEHQFHQEVRDMLEVARVVLQPEDYRRYMAALVARGKGDSVEQDA